jgi:carboxymethylenebutenolidase
MLRRLVLTLFAVVPLLGCSRAAPPARENSADESPQARLESVAYLPDDPNVHGFLCHPGGKGPYPALLMIHDYMGLTDGIKSQSYRLARAGYVVLAVNLYRSARLLSAKEAERQERKLPRERALRDLKAAVDYLTQRSDVRPKSPIAAEKGKDVWDLGVIGLGMGGTYALDAALRDPRLRALVMCYCPLPTDAKQLEPLNASVFCIVAGKDKRVTAEMIQKFGDAMRAANKRVHLLRVYGDCPAGFLDEATWPAESEPKESDIEEAWKLIKEYLSNELK